MNTVFHDLKGSWQYLNHFILHFILFQDFQTHHITSSPQPYYIGAITLQMTKERTREMKRLVCPHMLREATLHQWSLQFVSQVLLTEHTALDGTIPFVPLPKISNKPPWYMAHFRTRRYDVMRVPVKPKQQARKLPGRLLESSKKKSKLLFMSHTSYVIGIKNMSLMQLTCIFSRIFSTLSQKNLIRNACILAAGSACVISLCVREE